MKNGKFQEGLRAIIIGIENIHDANIIHRDIHSGNILTDGTVRTTICDLGLCKSSTESSSEDIYGVIPYMAPEIFQRQTYTMASDIYSFGVIMWEVVTRRRPFWYRSHDTELIIDICNGLRPQIFADVPEGYVNLMQLCWDNEPNKRPTAVDISEKLVQMRNNEVDHRTEVKIPSDIGPNTNNSGAIYSSRLLTGTTNSAMSLICIVQFVTRFADLKIHIN
ncbi:7070_t:CDS:2 [Funneliformis geosporum]|uniref:7070_t:CDS:1 n=1 Tax=Funneliformis geosporum TaxID=1117311 RepID=A0A9W4SKC1_9GLOM|nr:7070_t:CDS:2 [Funneliformis geosporum]